MSDSTYFSNLYGYSTENGIVIPETSRIKSDVESWMRNVVFPGEDIDLTPSTALGRIVEGLTVLFVDVLGVNAQNANSINPNVATGSYLDSIGKLFGISREDGESDIQLRQRILSSQSTGIGYAKSIKNAVSKVDGVKSVCVLENGSGYNRVVSGIALAPHSIFVCIGKDNPSAAPSDEMKSAIADAIYRTKSCGCSFTNTTEHGTVYSVDIKNGDYLVSKVYFYIAQKINIAVDVTAKDISGKMSKSEVESTIRNIVISTLNGASIPYNVSKSEIVSNIALGGRGVVATDIRLYVDGSSVDSISILPNKFAGVSNSDIRVSVL